MAGYSDRKLYEKLGIKANMTISLISAPAGYDQHLGQLPTPIAVEKKLGSGPYDLIQYFTTSRADLEWDFDDMKRSLKPNGCLWVSWPKKASGEPTDLDENLVREVALENGLVDVKVAAIDDHWSGLKLVYRLKDRE